MEPNEASGPPDPLAAAAKVLLGVDYLFPYQRLVVANLLEAAEASGLAPAWPEGTAAAAEELEEAVRQALGAGAVEETCGREDAASLGRQLVILPTGAGKSLCFQLPALLLPRPTLVLYPILSLMSDQERRLRGRGVDPVVLRGGQEPEERKKLWNRLEAGDARIVISNPETLLTASVLPRLAAARFAHLVVDEAHCVSEWGESFRPSYLRVREILAAAEAPLATAFTATASPEVLEKIRSYVFGDGAARAVIGDPDRPNIDYAAVGTLLRDRTVAELLTRGERPAVVFCSSRSRTESLARRLRAERPVFPTRFYHAGLERGEKDEVEKWFFGSRDGVLVATCAYGLGVDKADIRAVVHRDCPPNVEAYLQESGRAGRDGRRARATLLWGPEDAAALAKRPEGPERDRMRRLLDYGREAEGCRRETLLGMLGAGCSFCSGCDSCRRESSGEYREKAALLEFVGRNARRYRLSEAARIIERRNGNGWTADDAELALRRLIADGSIRERSGPFWKGKLSRLTRRR